MSRLRKNADYVRWLAGDTLSELGNGVRAFAAPLIAFDVTRSFALAGLVGAAQAIATAVCQLPGGLLTDRFDRKKLMVISGLTGTLLFCVAAAAYLSGFLDAWWLLTIAVLAGIRSGLFSAVTNAALKNIVDADTLPRALSANQARDAALALTAGPLGGALFGLQRALPFLVSAITSLGLVLAARGIQRSLAVTNRASRVHVARDLTQGLRWLWRDPALRAVLIASMLINLATNGIFLTVTLTLQDASVPTWQIGLLGTGLAVGTLLGALFSGRLLDRIAAGKLVVAGIVSVCLLFVPFTATHDLRIVVACLVLAGLALPVTNAALGGYMVVRTPSDLQGRVNAAEALLATALVSVGVGQAGWGLERWGYAPTVSLFVGVLALSAALVTAHPAIRRIPLASTWKQAP